MVLCITRLRYVSNKFVGGAMKRIFLFLSGALSSTLFAGSISYYNSTYGEYGIYTNNTPKYALYLVNGWVGYRYNDTDSIKFNLQVVNQGGLYPYTNFDFLNHYYSYNIEAGPGWSRSFSQGQGSFGINLLGLDWDNYSPSYAINVTGLSLQPYFYYDAKPGVFYVEGNIQNVSGNRNLSYFNNITYTQGGIGQMASIEPSYYQKLNERYTLGSTFKLMFANDNYYALSGQTNMGGTNMLEYRPFDVIYSIQNSPFNLRFYPLIDFYNYIGASNLPYYNTLTLVPGIEYFQNINSNSRVFSEAKLLISNNLVYQNSQGQNKATAYSAIFTFGIQSYIW